MSSILRTQTSLTCALTNHTSNHCLTLSSPWTSFKCGILSRSISSFPWWQDIYGQAFSWKIWIIAQRQSFYRFASPKDWQLSSYLLWLGLSMAGTDSFLQLDLVSIYHIVWLLLSNAWPDKDTYNLIPVCNATTSMLRDVTIGSSLEFSPNPSASSNEAHCEPLLLRPHQLSSGTAQSPILWEPYILCSLKDLVNGWMIGMGL